MRYFLSVLPILASASLAAQAPMTSADSARHVLNRMGYGPTPGQVEAVAREGVLRWVDRQLAITDIRDTTLRSMEAEYVVLRTPMADMVAMQVDQQKKALKAQTDSAMIRQLKAEARAGAPSGARELRGLNAELQSVTLARATLSEHQLAEGLPVGFAVAGEQDEAEARGHGDVGDLPGGGPR